VAEQKIIIEIEGKGQVTVANLSEAVNYLKTVTKDADYQFRQEKISAAELQKTLISVDEASKKLNLSYKQQVDLNAQIYQVQQRASVGFKSLGKSLDDVNRSSGRFNMGMMEITRIVSDAPYGLRGVANNITQLLMVMNAPGWLSLAITGGLTAALLTLDKTDTQIQNLTESVLVLKKELGDLGKEQYKGILKQDLNKLQSEYDELLKQHTITTFGFNPFNPSQFGFKTYADTHHPEVVAKEKEILELRKKIQDVDKEITKEREKQVKKAKEEKSFYGYSGFLSYEKSDVWRSGGGNVEMMVRGQKFSGRNIDELNKKVKEYFDTLEKGLDEPIQQMTVFQSTGIHAIQTMTGLIHSEFKTAWQDAFGEANSLFEKFASEITSFFLSEVFKYGAFMLISSMFPGGGSFLSMLGKGIGIPGFAGGVRDYGGGWAKVGERGPELMYVPPGSDIYSNDESKRISSMLSNLTIPTPMMQMMQPVTIPIILDGALIGEATVDYMGRQSFRRAI
jgi:hypothetical protein